MNSRIPSCFIFLLFLILSADLSFSQVIKNEDGFALNIPTLPKNLDLLEVGTGIPAFSGIYINDHSVIYNSIQRKWHMFGIVKGEKSFIHLTADSLNQPTWIENKHFTDSGEEIWAPHIIAERGKYFMFYTRIGNPRQLVCVESNDLWNWSEPKLIMALRTPSGNDAKNKDPMILKDNGQWIMYFSMMKDTEKWVVGYSTSNDLEKWSKPQICFDEDTSMPGVESPFVIKRGAYYYIFISARPWPYGYLEVFRSTSPFLWKVTDKVKWMDWHAPEIVRDLDGKWYITLCGYEPERNGFSIWSLSWNDYLEDAETSVLVPQNDLPELKMINSPAEGIGPEDGVMRRDPSDIIKVGDFYYVWYSKGKYQHGYDATIWYASSADGKKWTEKGEALSRGVVGSWEEQSVFTPNILMAEGKYWLFYTAVPKPFFASGPNLTRTAIGIAVSDSPDGPWKRYEGNPVLRPSGDEKYFDGVRVDDACLLLKGGKYYLYYKGRQGINTTAFETKMGLAIADNPQGPYIKVKENPVIKGGHEVMVWPQGPGIAAMVSNHGPEDIKKKVFYAEDGIHFQPTHQILNTPGGAGSYRPEAFTDSGKGKPIEWGIHIVDTWQKKSALPYLERFDCVWTKTK
jgi:beta-xylosidase